MNTETFAYWLQGALELNPEMLEKGMTPEQVRTIQDHLDLVFNKVTPNRFEEKTSPDVPDFNFPLAPDWNTPICSGGQGGYDGADNQLFCSQVNSSMEFPSEEPVLSGCTSSLAEDLAIHMDGEKDERGGSTLLASC